MKIILEILIKPLLEKILSYIDTNDYWAAYAYIIGFVVLFLAIGCCISWILQKQKLKREIEKINLESKEKAVNLLKQLQEKRNKYIEQTILIQLSVKSCTEALLNKEESTLKQNRDELIDLFFNELVACFIEYIEVCDIFYRGERKKIIACIVDEILPFLQTTKMFLEVVNNQNILTVLDEQKAHLKKFTLNPVLRFVKDNLRFYQFLLKFRYNNEMKKIELE